MKKISALIIFAFIINLLSGLAVFAQTEIKIEAENYNDAITQMTVYNVRGKVVSFQKSQWMSYNINFVEAGKYQMITTGANTASVPTEITVDGISVTSGPMASTGSYNTYADASVAQINVKAGVHTIKITVRDSVSFDYFTLVKIGSYERGPLGDSNKIYAEDYDDGKEGIGYHDTTAGVDDMFATDRGDDVEVLDTPNGLAVLMSGTEWLCYTLNSPKEEAYTISVSAANQYAAAKIKIIVNGEEKFHKLISTTADLVTFKSNLMGNLYLPSGNSTIKIELTDITQNEKIMFSNFTINKMDPEHIGSDTSLTVKTEFENYIPGGEGVGYHDLTQGLDFDFYVDRGDDVEVGNGGSGFVVGAAGGEWWKYNMNITQKGKYKVLANIASPNEGNEIAFTTAGGAKTVLPLSNTGDWNTYQLKEIGFIDLDAGEQQLKTELTAGSINLDYFTFELVDTNFEFYAVYAGETPLIGVRTLPRGTDQFKIYFTIAVDQASVNNENIKISGNNTIIPVLLSVDKNVILVKLKKTLDYETGYSISISGIKSIYNQLISEAVTTEFITGSSENDSGTGEIILSESNINYNEFHFSGIVHSGSGVAIEGRKTALTYKNPSGVTTPVSVAEAYTDSEGKFEINYIMPENNECGLYIFYIADEYTQAPSEASVVYVSKALETQILHSFADAKNADEAKTIFLTYEQSLGLSLDDDLINIDNKESFYSHFALKNIKDIQQFRQEYNKYITFETINQTSSSDIILSILSSEEKCEQIGIDKQRADLISENKAGFVSDIAAIESKETTEEFIIAFNIIEEKWLKAEFEKTDVSTSAVSKDVYVGQGIPVNIGFTTIESDIKKVIYTLESNDSSLFDIIKTDLNIKGNPKLTKEGNKLTLTVTADSILNEVYSLGSLVCTAPDEEQTYTVKVSGSVEYEIVSGIYISTNILPKTIYFKVSENGKSSPTGTTKHSVGGGANVSVIPSETPAPTTAPDVEKEFAFEDLEGAKWAEESINSLLKKNIISKSEDAKFNPDIDVSREQFVKMVIEALGALKSDAAASLSDVSESEWYYPYIASAEAYGIISGDDKNAFGIGEKITRQDMSVIIYRSIKKLGIENNAGQNVFFADDEEIAEYAKESVYTMKSLKIINGVGNNTFDPKGNATRAMAAKVIFEMIKAVGI